MSLLCPDVGVVEFEKRLLVGRYGTITAATNASPTVVTFSPGAPPNGTLVTISGAVGNTNINGTFVVTGVSGATANLCSLSGTTLTQINGNGALSGSPIWHLGSMEALTLKLYKTNVTPSESDTAGSYTVADFTGYSDTTLNSKISASDWAVPTTSTGTTSSSSAQITYSATSAQTIYGYYVVGAVSGTLFYAELFGSSISLVNPSTLQLTPKLQLD